MRQIGWFAKYFYDLRDKEAAEKISKFTNARECFTLRGVGLRFFKVLNLLIESSNNTSLKNLGTQTIFKQLPLCELVRAVAIAIYDVRFLQYYYQLKAVFCRRYGIQRTLCGYPAHGQRRWSNAIVCKRNNAFILRCVLAYTLDIFKMKQQAVFKYSKQAELRYKSRTRKAKVKKIRYHKFRKVGERRLKLKRRKKSPWH